MIPKKGGTPLPPSPICLPREHGKAQAYATLLQEALLQSGWSANQRKAIRIKYRLWAFRAEGRDPHFEKYGSFPRAPGSAPPTTSDATVAAWRRLIPHSAIVRKRRRVPYRLREQARERDRYGDGDPSKDPEG